MLLWYLRLIALQLKIWKKYISLCPVFLSLPMIEFMAFLLIR